MHNIDGVNTKRLLPEMIWNIALSKRSASLTAIVPTRSTQYQQGRVRRVMLEFIVSSETRKYAWSVFRAGATCQRRAVVVGERRRDGRIRRPSRGQSLVFRVSTLTVLEDSDRVDSAQTTVRFSTWDVVAHTLCWTVVGTPA